MSFQSGKISGQTVLRFPDRAQAGAAAPSAAGSLPPVLIILHQETPTLGRVGNVLRALGHRLDLRRPRFGDPLARTAG
jgi:GMP synthase (glutamine-hydrolysing)